MTTLFGGPPALTNTQVGALTTAQIASATTADMAGLSPSQVPAITTVQIVAFGTAEIAAMLTADVAALNTAQLIALTTSQQSALTTSAIAALSGQNHPGTIYGDGNCPVAVDPVPPFQITIENGATWSGSVPLIVPNNASGNNSGMNSGVMAITATQVLGLTVQPQDASGNNVGAAVTANTTANVEGSVGIKLLLPASSLKFSAANTSGTAAAITNPLITLQKL